MSLTGNEIAFFKGKISRNADGSVSGKSLYWTSNLQAFYSTNITVSQTYNDSDSKTSTVYQYTIGDNVVTRTVTSTDTSINPPPAPVVTTIPDNGIDIRPIYSGSGWVFWYKATFQSKFGIGSYITTDLPRTNDPVSIPLINTNIIDLAYFTANQTGYYYYILQYPNGTYAIRYTTDILTSVNDYQIPTYNNQVGQESDVLLKPERFYLEGTTLYILGQFALLGRIYGALTIDITNPTTISYLKNSEIKLNQPSDAIRFTSVRNAIDDTYMFGCYFNQDTSTCNALCGLSSPCYQQTTGSIGAPTDYYAIAHIFENINSINAPQYFFATFANKAGNDFIFSVTRDLKNPSWIPVANFNVYMGPNSTVRSTLTYKPVSPIYYYFSDPTGYFFGEFMGSDSKVYLLSTTDPTGSAWYPITYDQQDANAALLPNGVVIRPTIDSIATPVIPTPPDDNGGKNIDRYFIITVIGLGVTIIFAFLAIYVRIIKRLQATM